MADILNPTGTPTGTPTTTNPNGTSTDALGNYYDASGKSIANPNPVTTPGVSNSTSNDPNVPNTPPPTTGTTTPPNDSTTGYVSGLDTNHQAYLDNVANIEKGILTPQQQSILDNTKRLADSLHNDQKTANQNYEGGVNTYAAAHGLQGSTYAMGQIAAATNLGLSKLQDLDSKSAIALGQLQDSFKQDDLKAALDKWNEYQDYATKKNDALIAQHKAVQDATDKVKADKIAADKVTYDTVTKPIQELYANVVGNNAPKSVRDAVQGAKTVEEAINAAGDWAKNATGTVGDYYMYKRSTINAGLTPLDYGPWKDKEDAKAAKLKANEAYATAYATATGKAAGEAAAGPGLNDSIQTQTQNATGITQATGLDLITFNYLTQGTSALTRMTGPQRQKVMDAANAWLNKNGIDYATFQAQYKAQNDVLQKNIERAANTKVFAGETSGSADALMSAINEKDMGNIKQVNILNLLLGKQVNDPTTTKYGFQIKAMGNDLAGYFAASRGATSPDDSDKADAAQVIADGMSTRSVQAFKDSININEEKIAGVVGTAVDSAQKSVWDLFGVGAKFQPKGAQVNPTTTVEKFVSSKEAKNSITPDVNNRISSITGGKTFKTAGELAIYMSNLPGATPESVSSVLKLLGFIK